MLKKLTGKNQKDYEYAARYVMDNADVSVFSELVEKDSFLFDFVKPLQVVLMVYFPTFKFLGMLKLAIPFELVFTL